MVEADANRLDLAKWLEGQSKRCTYVEICSASSKDSNITGWAIGEDSFAELLVNIDDVISAETSGVPKPFFMYAYKKEGDLKHVSRFIVRPQISRETLDEGGKGVIAELRGIVREMGSTNLEMCKVVVDQCRALGEATTKALAETTKQLADAHKDAWRVNEMIRELAEGKREEKREETEAKIALKRSDVVGDIVSALVPALAARLKPGIQGEHGPSGDLAVMTLFRTLTDQQIDTLVKENLLTLTPEQMISAGSIANEVELAAKNGGIESNLMKQLAVWFAMLSEEQTQSLRGEGRVKLDGVQISAFMNLYIACKEHAQSRSREDRAVS